MGMTLSIKTRLALYSATIEVASSHCDFCGGELRLKKVESTNRELDWEDEVLVCVNCGHELSCTVAHNHTAPHAKGPS